MLPCRVQVRSCEYLNNVIEQDHRRIKQRIRPMLGFKQFETAAVTIRGIELAEKIKKQQVQPQTTNRTSNHRSGTLCRGPGRPKSEAFSPDKNIHLRKFAPEHGSVADRRKIHAASMLYHIQNGSVPKLAGTSN
jgi:hypothetical protein